MLINNETDYAIRILRSLSHGEQIAMSEIAEAEMIPKQFAYKISKKLEKGGYIAITRGARGGCKLAKSLEEITLLDIVLLIEEHADLTHCMNPDYKCPWREHHGGCSVHCSLAKVQDETNKLFARYTIADMLLGK